MVKRVKLIKKPYRPNAAFRNLFKTSNPVVKVKEMSKSELLKFFKYKSIAQAKKVLKINNNDEAYTKLRFLYTKDLNEKNQLKTNLKKVVRELKTRNIAKSKISRFIASKIKNKSFLKI